MFIMFSTWNFENQLFNISCRKYFWIFQKFMLKHTENLFEFLILMKCSKEIFTDNIFVSLCKRIISVYETNH
ncbi:hypothetical protein HanRHA438_Chr04g0161131 [Helianthus annuus]|nr:hypothetical protein HanIR_Chr04g0162361 [Helianthus annuus]KAJ0925567.1 hypothetical protein HanRHA438_Chr04g0161131 [Helianthus annuus]